MVLNISIAEQDEEETNLKYPKLPPLAHLKHSCSLRPEYSGPRVRRQGQLVYQIDSRYSRIEHTDMSIVRTRVRTLG